MLQGLQHFACCTIIITTIYEPENSLRAQIIRTIIERPVANTPNIYSIIQRIMSFLFEIKSIRFQVSLIT